MSEGAPTEVLTALTVPDHGPEPRGYRALSTAREPSGRSRGADDVDGSLATVLLVDESRLARIAVARIIERIKGMAVIEARNGEEAVEILGREAPSVVVTELEMSRMSGLELVAEIRSFHPQVPVVFMTAHGGEEAAVQALRAGATSYVHKAALFSDLPETLRKVLSIAVMERRKRSVKGCLEHREVRFRVPNDPGLIDPLVELLLEDLSAIETCDSASRMRVGMALHEALTNAMLHGNLEVSSDLRQDDENEFFRLARERRRLAPYRDRRVEVYSRVDRQGAEFVIGDEGPGFDAASLMKPVREGDMLRIGGRGLLLIRAFMDEVQHNDEGNRITMTKRLAPQGLSQSRC